MYETADKFSKYFQHKSLKAEQIRNKAFNSLSFRGNRGYSKEFLNKVEKIKNKQKTYGGIISVKNNKGEYMYALVQGRYTGKWSFPKGHSNKGEGGIECTLREIGEETSIDKLPSPIEYVEIGYGRYFVFNLEEAVPLIPRDTREIMDTKWVTLEEMEGMSLNADASLYRKKLINESLPGDLKSITEDLKKMTMGT